MGNYESLRLDIDVEDSVRQVDIDAAGGEGKGAISAAEKRIYGFVSQQLINRVNEVEAELNNTKG